MKKKALSLLLASAMVLSMAACGNDSSNESSSASGSESSTTESNSSESSESESGDNSAESEGSGPSYTYRQYTAVSPSNWNQLTYEDSNDTQIMDHLSSNFFSYNFKYDDAGEIVPGEFVMEYSAATALEDVSDKVDAKWNVPAGEKGYAYKITLREDLKWEDGTPITAEDFVYTMQQQLDPLFQNYRADSFYSAATVIVNARNYAKQGTTDETTDNSATGLYTIEDLVKGDDGVYTQPDGGMIKFSLSDSLSHAGDSVDNLASYLDADSYAALQALADENGRVPVTDETIALFTTLIDTPDWGNEPPEYVPRYMVYEYTYPAVDFNDVGIYVGDTDYEIILVLEKALPLLKEDGSLSYQAAYNMASLPLVKKDLYESCKVEPAAGATLWTTTYNSSVETTASWGPYKLESFQAGKQYTLVKNENWFGYSDPQYDGQYQTTRIVCDTIAEWNAAWLKFLAGEIDGISIDASIADEYKGSERAYFTPNDFVASMQLQSNVEQLKARESDGINKSILGYADFRKALSLALDRADFATKTTTSSLAGFGLFNSMHYYDVENGGVYRNTDEARQVLCDVYAVDPGNYGSLEEAADAITGYNLEEARELLTKAYNDALAAGDIKETDKVFLTFGSGVINETLQRRVDFLKNAFQELAKTTPLEGRIDVELKDFAASWATDFQAGAYDICLGGWNGAAWDPGYFLLAYLSPDYMYSRAWDTSAQMMTFTMKGVGENGADVTETMSLIDWYNCLNGLAGAKYNWSAAALPNAQRLQLIAALEKEVLQAYYTVPMYNQFDASLLSYKVDYVTYEYNTFMGYGGVRYMTYNYNDEEWAAAVAEQNGELNYK